MTPLGFGGTPCACFSSTVLQKRLKFACDPESLVVLEAAAALLRVGGSALLRLPMLFIMPARLLQLITAAEHRPPGAEGEPGNYQQIPNRYGLNGNKSIRNALLVSKLFQPTPGALETANEGHAPEAKSPGHQLHPERSGPRRTSSSGTDPAPLKMFNLNYLLDWSQSHLVQR